MILCDRCKRILLVDKTELFKKEERLGALHYICRLFFFVTLNHTFDKIPSVTGQETVRVLYDRAVGVTFNHSPTLVLTDEF